MFSVPSSSSSSSASTLVLDVSSSVGIDESAFDFIPASANAFFSNTSVAMSSMMTSEEEDIDFVMSGPTTEMDTVYRGMAVPREHIAFVPVRVPSSKHEIAEIDTRSNNKPILVTTKNCPHKPCSLSNTHVILTIPSQYSFGDLLKTIQASLDGVVDYDFSYSASESLWRGKYCFRSHSCVVDVRLFCDLSKNSQYILEVVKLRGDGFSFRGMFHQVRNSLEASVFATSTENTPRGFRSPMNLSSPLSTPPLSRRPSVCSSPHEQVLNTLKVVHGMSQCQFLDNKIEGARMFCDLIQQDPSTLSHPDVVSDVMIVVKSFIEGVPKNAEDNGELLELTLLALSSFCVIPSYRIALLATENYSVLREVLSVLFAPTQEFAFEQAHLRRECMQLLVDLSSDAQLLFQRLGQVLSNESDDSGLVKEWFITLATLFDKNIQSKVENLRSSFEEAGLM